MMMMRMMMMMMMMTNPKFWSWGGGAAARSAHSWIRHCFSIKMDIISLVVHIKAVYAVNKIS